MEAQQDKSKQAKGKGAKNNKKGTTRALRGASARFNKKRKQSENDKRAAVVITLFRQ